MTEHARLPRAAGAATYEDKPWLAQLTPQQRAPVTPPETLVHAFRDTARAVPDRAALAYFDGRLTYAETDALSDGIAAHLAARGLERGDRLALMLQNTPHFVLALLGAWKAGAVVVPVNPMYKDREVAHVLQDAQVSALVCSDRAWEAHLRTTVEGTCVHTALTACELDLQTRNDPRVLDVTRSASGATRTADTAATAATADTAVEELLSVARSGAAPPPGREPAGADTALISYTSGTSGAPKGAMNTHANLTFNAERQRVSGTAPEGSCVYALAPLFHITGMVSQLAGCLLNAGTLALTYRFEAGVVLDAFLEHRPAFTVGPSTAFMALAAHPAASREHFASFTHLASGGAPLPPALVERFRAAFGPYIGNGYGLTECTAPCASVPPGREAPVDPDSGTLAVGVPGPDTVVRVLDDTGEPVPFGQHGEIAVRGPQVVPGYWRRPEDTAAGMPEGELRTGDIGFMDEDGWLYVVDRKKDMINASGFKVWPREVEDVLYTHPAVREAAVVGVPHDYRGETVKAYVSLRDDSGAVPDELPGELRDHCRERLAAYKYPREVEILPELPRTASGKILRRELRSRTGSA